MKQLVVVAASATICTGKLIQMSADVSGEENDINLAEVETN
jgi:hypothetical protein